MGVKAMQGRVLVDRVSWRQGARRAGEAGGARLRVNRILGSVPLLACFVSLAGCTAHYVAPEPSSGQTAEVEFVFMGSSLTSSVTAAIGDCGKEKHLGFLRSGMLLRGDNRVIGTVVDTSKPLTIRLELLGPVTGPFCKDRQEVTLMPDRAYRIEVGRGEQICTGEVFERADGGWQKLSTEVILECNQ